MFHPCYLEYKSLASFSDKLMYLARLLNSDHEIKRGAAIDVDG